MTRGRFQRGLGIDGLTEDQVRRTVAAYYGMVTAMDEMVGSILDELRRQGLDEDTYVVYTSDHGETLGNHGLFYKQCSYEDSVGVPLIVRGPGVPAGAERDDLVSLVDLYPTIVDMAGLKTEPDRPGTSWLRLIDGEAPSPEFAFSEFHGNFFKDSWYMIRQGDYKYTHYVGDAPTLYDMRNDPRELVDLTPDPAYADVLARCEATLRTVVDPEAVALRAKRDLGLIGPDGEDYTGTLTVADVEAGRAAGRFPPEPELVR